MPTPAQAKTTTSQPVTYPAAARKVAKLTTDRFTVLHYAADRDVHQLFEPHQMYPGCAHRPVMDLSTEDPITDPRPGLISRTTPVGSMGSCFARELKRWLLEHGYNFVMTEEGPGCHPGSARFGTVYNTGTLRQIAESAHGLFSPIEPWWTLPEALLDPYRACVAWPDVASARAERKAHGTAVREMFRRCSVFIATAGLSEVWRSREDGAVFAQTPPPSAYDPKRHEVALLSVEENIANLSRFYELARSINPKLQLVLTLSPVPLLGTFFPRSAVLSDSVSKATLRVALDAFCRAHPEVVYFPAYEIVTRLSPSPYLDDHRHVRPEVIDRVMRTFIRHYGDPADSQAMQAAA